MLSFSLDHDVLCILSFSSDSQLPQPSEEVQTVERVEPVEQVVPNIPLN